MADCDNDQECEKIIPDPIKPEPLPKQCSGGDESGGTSDFNELDNRPKYDGRLMTGNTDIPNLSGAVSQLSDDVEEIKGDIGDIEKDLEGKADKSDVKTYTAGDRITIKSDNSINADGLVILSYGNSTWQDFLSAYRENAVVYCRASSQVNPATGSQTRLAFMAFVSNETNPTSVEFQYVRSVSNKSISDQTDQTFVYKLTSSGTWSVETRNVASKIIAGEGLTSSYSNGAITLSATGGGGSVNAARLVYAYANMPDYPDSDYHLMDVDGDYYVDADITAINDTLAAGGSVWVALVEGDTVPEQTVVKYLPLVSASPNGEGTDYLFYDTNKSLLYKFDSTVWNGIERRSNLIVGDRTPDASTEPVDPDTFGCIYIDSTNQDAYIYVYNESGDYIWKKITP